MTDEQRMRHLVKGMCSIIDALRSLDRGDDDRSRAQLAAAERSVLRVSETLTPPPGAKV